MSVLHAIIQNRYLRQDLVLPTASLPIWERWSQIVLAIPQCRGDVRLASDLSHVYAEAERSWTGTRLYLALDLSVLQACYWRFLKNCRLTFPHVADYHVAAIQMWQTRLFNRWNETAHWDRRKGKVVAPVAPEPSPRAWMN
jgi:hypothetical protein